MPFYNDLRPKADYEKNDYALVFPTMKDDEKVRAIEGILRLREGLEASIPPRKAEQNLLIGSWNIKEFGHTKQRLPEAYFYIAEILSRFDLVVVQEVKSTLVDLKIVMRLLGSDWGYLVNDITSGTDGNSERSAFLFNSKRCHLSGTAGELVLWDALTQDSEIKQLKRTPYLMGFRAGWKNFALLNVHLQPGDDDWEVKYRKEEVRLLISALKEKMKETWTPRLVVAGDFNFYDRKDVEAVEMFNEAGFYEVDNLIGVDTNVAETDAFDRLFIRHNKYFSVARDCDGKTKGGVFNPFEYVYRTGEEATYKREIIEAYTGAKDLENDDDALEKQFRVYWKRNQISDHYPIWFELEIDSAVPFLESKLKALEASA